jgi:MFS family permease
MRYTSGWLGDTLGRKRVYASAFIVQGVGLLIFAQLTSDRLWLLPFYFLTFAVGQSTMIVLGQTMVADYFGPARFASIRGFSSSLQTPVGIFCPLFAGWMFDQTGSYVVPFTVFGIASFTGALWISLIRRPLWSELEDAREAAEAALPAAPVQASVALQVADSPAEGRV